jgi:hypothetical protein
MIGEFRLIKVELKNLIPKNSTLRLFIHDLGMVAGASSSDGYDNVTRKEGCNDVWRPHIDRCFDIGRCAPAVQIF